MSSHHLFLEKKGHILTLLNKWIKWNYKLFLLTFPLPATKKEGILKIGKINRYAAVSYHGNGFSNEAKKVAQYIIEWCKKNRIWNI